MVALVVNGCEQKTKKRKQINASAEQWRRRQNIQAHIVPQDDTTLPYITPGMVASVYPKTWAGILGGMVAEQSRTEVVVLVWWQGKDGYGWLWRGRDDALIPRATASVPE